MTTPSYTKHPIDPVELTSRLVAIDTSNGGEAEAMSLCLELLRARDFTTRDADLEPGRPNVVAHAPGAQGRAALCFAGHLDVVPVGTAPWRGNPFSGRVKSCPDGDAVYGRGTGDMKAGVAAMLAAVLDLLDTDNAPPLCVILTSGEETGCLGARRLAEAGLLPEGALGLVVPEPTLNTPALGHKGATWLRASTRGKSSHGSMPEKGINAIYRAAEAVLAARDALNENDADPILGRATVNVGTIAGGSKINMTPDRASFEIDCRAIPNLDGETLIARLREAMGEDVAIETIESLPSLLTPPDHAFARMAVEAARDVLGVDIEAGAASFFTDASPLSQAMGDAATVILGPGDPALAHQTDEYCLVSRIHEAAAIYRALAQRMAGV